MIETHAHDDRAPSDFPTPLHGAVARAVLRRVYERPDRVAEEAMANVRDEHPAYASIRDPATLDAMREATAEAIRVFGRWAMRRRRFSPEERRFLEAEAAASVGRLIPLEVLLQAVRVGQRTLWNWLVRECGDDADGRDAALVLLAELVEYSDQISRIFTDAYLATQRQASAEEDRLKRDLAEDLVSGRALRDAVLARLDAYGLDVPPYVVALVATSRSDAEAVWSSARTIEQRLEGRCLIVVRHDRILGIFAGRHPEEVTAALREAARVLAAMRSTEIVAGVSGPAAAVPEIAVAHAQAERLLALAAHRSESVLSPGDVRLLEYLVARADATVDGLVPPEVGMLIEEDSRKRGALLQTLLAYLEADLNAGRAAEALVVHPNTIHYRLRRISEVTGRDMRSFNDLLDLYVGVLLLAPDVLRAEP